MAMWLVWWAGNSTLRIDGLGLGCNVDVMLCPIFD
jgi:hypothetical protein